MTNNPLSKGIKAALSQVPSDYLALHDLTVEVLLNDLPNGHSIYPPLLLLPAHAFTAQSWARLLSTWTEHHHNLFFGIAANCLQVTHIALNAPIALNTTPHKRSLDHHMQPSSDDEIENIQRRPNITPVFGTFPAFVDTPSPSAREFMSALWVSTRQNGITQIWAPQYTMFSRGNVKEKARLLSLPTLTRAVAEDIGCTAVDLFAGIGYFVFSYAKAGCQHVLGFELNPWSVEGLRRGAESNKWPCSIMTQTQVDECLSGDSMSIDLNSRIVVFQSTNTIATRIIQANRTTVPPVRHVNLGLLPTSSGAYQIALDCLDPVLGGWLHIHENFAIHELDAKANEVLRSIERLLQEQDIGSLAVVKLQHIEKVKTYAPGVMHCVLDIHIYHGNIG